MFETMIIELKLANVSPKTIDAYLFHNKRFLNFIRKKPQEVTTWDVKSYLLDMRVKQMSPRTIRLAIFSLKYYYQKILKRNIMRSIQKPKIPQQLPRILEKEEIVKMIDTIENPKHKLLISLIYSAGLRVSEAVKMKREDIFEDRRLAIVKAGKGRKDRYTILSNHFLDLLKNYRCYSEYLFPGRKTHLSARSAELILENAARKAGIKRNVFPHRLRASFATHLIDEGTDISLVSQLLGHSSINTTKNSYIRSKTSHFDRVKSPLDG